MLIYEDALKLLHQVGRNARWICHCLAVARVAGRVAEILDSRRVLDTNYLTVGALLHDIGRYKTHDPVLHGVEGYRLLTDLGHDREAFICASHVLCGLSADEAVQHGLPAQDFVPGTLEQWLVPVIDSVVEFDRPTTLEQRCNSIRMRYQGNAWFLERFAVAEKRAGFILDRLHREFGISLERVAAEALPG